MPDMVQSVENDIQLVQRARDGDFEAFEALVGLYERRIYCLALRIVGLRHDAEEVVQQTFLSVIEHIHKFREESRFSHVAYADRDEPCPGSAPKATPAPNCLSGR